MIPHNYGLVTRQLILAAVLVQFAWIADSQTLLPSAFNSDTVLSRANSPYLIHSNLTTATGVVLQIEAGVVIKFDAGASLDIRGKLIARGTVEDSIFFISNNSPAWQRINSTAADIDLKFCRFKGGNMFLWASGGKSISITNCVIESKATGSGEDCIAVHEASRVYIDSIRLSGMGGLISQGSKNDAIDLDDVDSCFILNSEIMHFSDDGIDIGTGSRYALISGNRVSYCNYGTTVGENSLAYIENNIYTHNDAALQVHTHAVIYVDYNTFYHNTWGIECYHSEDGSAETGGTAFVRNTIFSATDKTEILTQTSSSVTISYSVSDSETLPGDHNIYGDPKLSDPDQDDFSLQESSPCIHAGSPGTGGNNTTMGAFGDEEGTMTNMPGTAGFIHILAYPNPTTSGITIKSSLQGYPQIIKLYDFQGKVVFTKTILADTFQIDLSTLPPGLFLLRISSGTRSGFVQIIKE